MNITTRLVFLAFSSLILFVASTNIYTVEDAQKCFHERALEKCSEVISQCLEKEQCRGQLQNFQDCNFEREHENEVFNGNCFSNWQQTSILSKQVIQCFDKECKLAQYNSDVSLPVLYSCSTQALLNTNIDCNQQCQEILTKLISDKIPYLPIQQIYALDLQSQFSEIRNQSVLKIVLLIKEECIDPNGSIRKRHEENKKNKKMNQQKINQMINQNQQQQPILKENIQVISGNATMTTSDL